MSSLSTAPATAPPPAPGPGAPPNAPEGVRFHHLARLWGVGAWRCVGSALATLAGFALAAVAFVAAAVWLVPLLGLSMDGQRVQLVLLYGAVAASLPVVLITVRLIERRPVGTLWSVRGRPRWSWLGVCLCVAVPAVLAMATAMMIIGMVTGNGGPAAPVEWVRWDGIGEYLAGLALMLSIVAVQTAAEEVIFRGVLLQAAGRFFRSMWPPVLIQAVVFAAVHGVGNWWGSLTMLCVGVVLGWLAVRTGGLEAGIALHLVVNVLPIPILFAATGENGSIAAGTAADATAWIAAVQPVGAAIYAAAVVYIAARMFRLPHTTSGTSQHATPTATADQPEPATVLAHPGEAPHAGPDTEAEEPAGDTPAGDVITAGTQQP